MALFPEPREDLMAEATAMPQRGEFQLEGDPSVYFIGFRRNRAASVYFGVDPVLHFNSQQQLRRLFLAGEQFVAQQGRLVRRSRSKPGGRVTSTDTALSAEEEARWMGVLMPSWRNVSRAVDRRELNWLRTTVAAGWLQASLEKLIEANTPEFFLADDLRL